MPPLFQHRTRLSNRPGPRRRLTPSRPEPAIRSQSATVAGGSRPRMPRFAVRASGGRWLPCRPLRQKPRHPAQRHALQRRAAECLEQPPPKGPQVVVGQVQGTLKAALGEFGEPLSLCAIRHESPGVEQSSHQGALKRLKSDGLRRERIVGSCLSALVPIRIKSELGGGSSSVFSRQFALSSLRKSASSMMATLRPPMKGLSAISWHKPSRIRRASSPTKAANGIVLLSAGFSMRIRSGCVCASTCRHEVQTPHGDISLAGESEHSTACASFSAKVRLPIPAGPTNRNVLAKRSRQARGGTSPRPNRVPRCLATPCDPSPYRFFSTRSAAARMSRCTASIGCAASITTI